MGAPGGARRAGPGATSGNLTGFTGPAAKLAATRGYGAEVITYDRFTEDRQAISQRLAQERGMTLIPPYDHPDVLAGQGTAAKELFDVLTNMV